MSTESSPRPKRTLMRLLLFIGVTASALVIASVVFAGWTTIDMLDNTVNTTPWGTATYTEGCSDAPSNQRDNLENAWFKYDGTNIYFRVETCGSPALSATDRRAVGMIDCNDDGDFTDANTNGYDGDRLIIYSTSGVVVRDGATTQLTSPLPGDNTDTSGANIEWQVPLAYLPPICRASTNQVNITWAIAQVSPPSSYTVLAAASQYFAHNNAMDYGDAGDATGTPPACSTPSVGNPQTRVGCNGPRHGLVPLTPGIPLQLGSAAVDADGGENQSTALDADDTTGTTPNDEGGIAPATGDSWSDGSGQLTFTISGGETPHLSCWVDFDKNGTWTDTVGGVSENVVADVSISNVGGGTKTVAVTIPSLTWPIDLPARCRVWPGTPAALPPYGPVEFGEVEDNLWSFDAGGNYVSAAAPAAATNLQIATSGTTDVNLTWTNPAPNDAARVLASTTNAYLTSATGGFLIDQVDNAAPWEYTHLGILGAPADSVFYVVYGRLGTTDASTPSNRVGLIEFPMP